MSPILLGTQDKAGTRRRSSAAARTPTRRSTTGARCRARIKWGNTHGVVEDSQRNIYVHHTVHATSESADTMVVFDEKGTFVRSWGREFRGVAHGLHIRNEGKRRVPLPHGQRHQPAPDAAAGDAGGRRQGDARGEIVWKIQGPPDVAAYQPAATARRSATTRPTSRSRPTATSTSATATARTTSISTTAAEYIRTFGGKGSEPGQLAEPHGIWVDTRGRVRILVVADRRNNRLQRFTLDGKHVDFVPGFRLPCHFDEQKGTRRRARSARPVTLIDAATRSSSTSAIRTRPTGTIRLRTSRATFIPGQFICPHGACFDHATVTSSSWSGSRSAA